MRIHSSFNRNFSSFDLVGIIQMLRFNKFNKFSVGFKSGDYSGGCNILDSCVINILALFAIYVLDYCLDKIKFEITSYIHIISTFY